MNQSKLIAALTLAAAALVTSFLPAPGLYFAVGLGFLGGTLGILTYQNKQLGPKRLWAAAGIVVSAIAILLGTFRFITAFVGMGKAIETLSNIQTVL